jgi:hypothetical protein
MSIAIDTNGNVRPGAAVRLFKVPGALPHGV